MIILAEFNFYRQKITSTGRIWLPLAEHGLCWLIVTLAGRIWLILAEYDLYWLIVTLTGRICSQSSVLPFCRFNIPAGGSSTMQVIKRADEIIIPFFIQSVIYWEYMRSTDNISTMKTPTLRVMHSESYSYDNSLCDLLSCKRFQLCTSKTVNRPLYNLLML